MKKQYTHSHLAFGLVSSLLLSAASALQGSTLVSYGPTGSYVTSDVNFQRMASSTPSSTDPYTYELPFSDTAVLRSTAAFYTGPTFYGGYRFTSSTVPGAFNHQKVRIVGDYDEIFLQSRSDDAWNGSTLTLHAMFMFLQQDFNAGFETGDLSISGVSFTLGSGYFQSSVPSTVNGESRLAVRIDGTYYLSETVFNIASNASYSLSGSALSDANWATFNPAANIDFDAGSAVFDSLDLVGVTAVGLYFEEDGWTARTDSGVAYGLSIRAFDVQGAVIPEASHVALATGLAGLALIVFRRFRRS